MSPSLRKSQVVFGIAAAAVLQTACFKTTIVNGNAAAAQATVKHDESWHHGAVLGVVEISGPYALEEACPEGWAEIHTKTSFINGLVQVVVGFYNPQTVTIRCQQGGAQVPAGAETAAAELPQGDTAEGSPAAQ